MVSQSLAFEIGVMSLVLPVGWMLAPAIADFLGLPEANGALLVRLAILQAPFFVFVNLSLSLLKWTFKRWQFLLMAVGTTVATLAGLLIGLFFFDLDIVGVFTVYFIVRAVFALLGLWMVREWLTFPTELEAAQAASAFRDLVRVHLGHRRAAAGARALAGREHGRR